MTHIILLDRFKEVSEAAIRDLMLPVMMQKNDLEQQYRTADVYRMRLPNSSAAKQKAPYIIHQLITAKDIQHSGNQETASAVVRSIFSVYHYDEQEGALALLNLMERLRICLLKQVILGEQFQLDLEAGLEVLIYPEDSAPFYAGEMISTWNIPGIKREVPLI